MWPHPWSHHIIPYQELLGNYNLTVTMHIQTVIIPYQELLGNYNQLCLLQRTHIIIPYQELLGNYNRTDHNDQSG